MDDKWIGIACEAMGSYWHGEQSPNQQEADRKKRLIHKSPHKFISNIKNITY
ncbi:MAG: hypothetical protein ACFFDF_11660 [Candidatus Odinarchaeota archaeon]